MEQKTKVILFVVFIISAILFLLIPAQERNGEASLKSKVEKLVDPFEISDELKKIMEEKYRLRRERLETAKNETGVIPGSSPPSIGVFHSMLPMQKDNEWIYHVKGPEYLVKEKKWILRVIKEPTDESFGILESGFGNFLLQSKVWKNTSSILLERLPFSEAVEFLYNKPVSVTGETLPPTARMINGAVWAEEIKRNIIHRFTDNKSRVFTQEAVAFQKNRAHCKDALTIHVPAGKFLARQISWTSRVSIKAGEKPVLKHLTATPYRYEEMYVSLGIGIVKRSIKYSSEKDNPIVFELVKFAKGSKKNEK